jgi:hypothetical protein
MLMLIDAEDGNAKLLPGSLPEFPCCNVSSYSKLRERVALGGGEFI